ncbi:DUF998 domain-containing protein [Demequina sp.]|uniref:DUF998 domain-containing protein n=1 Tax=Demequina sp. TaxID=2050685 RepID=UPI003D0A0D31
MDAEPGARTPDSLLRVESQAIWLALVCGGVGALAGLVLTSVNGYVRLSGADSFGLAAAALATVVAALVSAVGYWRSRNRPGQEWRLTLGRWTTFVTLLSVVLVHSALAFLGTYALYVVLSLAFIGLNVSGLFAAVMMGATLGLVAFLVFPSVAQVTTQRLSTLLMSYVVVGCLTAAVTTSDPLWWRVHFSQLGTFGDISSWMFNATLVAAGLLVTTFAVYLAHDIRELVAAGKLANASAPQWAARLFVILGVMLAGVGLVPVDVSFLVHTICASGMAVVFLILLIGGRSRLAGMESGYFVAAWAILAGIAVSIALFLARVFSVTAFEIIVFVLIFGWIAVFIRFLGLAARND